MSAMDVICVEDENGELISTPFYAGFSGPLIGQATEEKVHLVVNYKPIREVELVKDISGLVLFEGKGSIEGRKMPSPKDLKAMGLKKGPNSIAFATATTNQMVSAKIFLWDQSEKIIVTDIDGTITRSDKRGHFYSRIGLNWHHNSVVTCFQTLYKLGYKILYLTARSVTMDTITRKYLDDLQLPAGPLLLSYKGFMDAITSEVITRDAKLIKFEHLSNIIKIFPSSNEVPIVAGFGNNENDEWAYTEAKVPPDHIFIVNKKSEIIVGKAKTSYEVVQKEVCNFFKDLVDHLKNSSELLPDKSKKNNDDNENNESHSSLGKDTDNPLKDIDKHNIPSPNGSDDIDYGDDEEEEERVNVKEGGDKEEKKETEEAKAERDRKSAEFTNNIFSSMNNNNNENNNTNSAPSFFSNLTSKLLRGVNGSLNSSTNSTKSNSNNSSNNNTPEQKRNNNTKSNNSNSNSNNNKNKNEDNDNKDNDDSNNSTPETKRNSDQLVDVSGLMD